MDSLAKRTCPSVVGIAVVEQVLEADFTGYILARCPDSNDICRGPKRVKRLHELLYLHQVIARCYLEHLAIPQSRKNIVAHLQFPRSPEDFTSTRPKYR